MAKVKLYVANYCPYCRAAEKLLGKKGVRFEAVDITEDAKTREWLVQTTGFKTVPQIFINEKPIGGFSDLEALDKKGELDKLLAG